MTGELAQAYKMVIQQDRTIALANTCGTLAGCFHPVLTVAAVQMAYRALPKETQIALRTIHTELCIS